MLTANPEIQKWDMIVIGAGSAGMPAALFAAKRGAKVLLVEAAEAVGGTMWVSTGQMSAAGTVLQKSKGIEDNAEAHYEDVMRISHGTANPAIVRLAVDNAADTFDWLMEHGFSPEPDHPITGYGHEHYRIPRYYWAAGGGMAIKGVLEPLLMAEVARGAITLKTSHRAVELIADEDGAVCGVVAEDGEGEQHHFFGDRTVLATGGYSANSSMFERISGHPQYSAMPYKGSQGTGHLLGLSVGGYLRGSEHFFIGFGLILDDEVRPAKTTIRAETYPERRQPWEVYVNANGHRFVREDMPSIDAREHALLDQPGLRYWIVFDEAMLHRAPPLIIGWDAGQIRDAAEAGRPSFFRSDTLASLARAAGIDPDGLVRTIAAYNYGVATGHDFLGRQHLPMPIGEGPFYAVRMQGVSITSAAGLAIDDELRVIRDDGTPIPNLYAAGELLGSSQTMGRAACGGMMVTPALTFGRLLGQSMVPLSVR